MFLVPERLFLTRGVGRHKQELRSFELALRDAGIEKCNLVQVSSILPPRCKIIRRARGVKEIVPGQITFCVMARCSSNEPHRLIASSIGIAVPTDKNSYGYLSEHHAYGQTDEAAGDEAEDMAAAMLASTLGLEFDENKSWDEQKEVYRMSGKIVKATNITQSAVITSGYTTVIAVAVFLFDREEQDRMGLRSPSP
ncbi:MAG: arginine decarboxylase, pyruvoyl-dependent [Candidatus Tritonobacter lacicola]|nr:arginine decarboxylase, pyruvoyl-dependent [Candidatus Tritonobacter lacicola]